MDNELRAAVKAAAIEQYRQTPPEVEGEPLWEDASAAVYQALLDHGVDNSKLPMEVEVALIDEVWEEVKES